MNAQLTFNETELVVLYKACNNEWLRLHKQHKQAEADNNDSLASLLHEKMLTIDSLMMMLYSVMPNYKA